MAPTAARRAEAAAAPPAGRPATARAARAVRAPPARTSRRGALRGAAASAAGLLAAGAAAAAAVAAAAAAAAVAAAAAAASASASTADDPRALVAAGMRAFERGDVAASLDAFDAALVAAPSMRPYLWQRGLSLYYLGSPEDPAPWREGARQFRDDVAVNPNDTEEAIWAFLCEARLEGAPAARAKFLKVGRDRRPVMRAAVEAFEAGSVPERILVAAGGDGEGHDGFYARLYVGLWHESEGDVGAARAALEAAAATAYARGSGDYMAALARVHCRQRGWAAPA
jgi:hypothetical protein